MLVLLTRTLFTPALRPLLALSMLLASLTSITTANAEITKLTLHRRSCASATAYVNYDGFAEGASPYYVAFGADTNGNGIFGEPNEALVYARIRGNVGRSIQVAARVKFAPVPEGTTIALIAYTVDSAGNALSPQLGPVSYACSQRPALDPLPAESSQLVPSPAVVAAILSEAVTVYSGPSVKTTVIGGLGKGQRVPVVALNVRGDWALIELDGQQGWILWRTNAYLFGARETLPRLPNYES
jgi:Bacterial SH3 domain